MKRATIVWVVCAFLCLPGIAADYWRTVGVDYAVPVILVDATDGYTPETEKKAADTTVTYCNITDGNSPSSYTDDDTLWKEIGDGTGEYRLIIGAGEFTTVDKDYLVKVVVSGCRTVRFVVHTLVGSPGNMATTDDGGPIDVNEGIVNSNATQYNGHPVFDSNVPGMAPAVVHFTDDGDDVARVSSLAYAPTINPDGSMVVGELTVAGQGYVQASLAADFAATNGYIADANGFAEDANLAATAAKTAAEKIDTTTELRTLLTGSDTAVSTITVPDVNTAATTWGFATVADINTATTTLGWQVQATIAAGTHTATTFVLNDSAGVPSADDWFGRRQWIAYVTDTTTGFGSFDLITAYIGATRTVTVASGLKFVPEEDDVVYILPMGWSRPSGGSMGP